MKYINIKSAKIYFTFIVHALISTAMARELDDKVRPELLDDSSALSNTISFDDKNKQELKKNESKQRKEPSSEEYDSIGIAALNEMNEHKEMDKNKNKLNHKNLMNELKVESKWTPGMCANLCRSESCLKAGSVLSMSDMATICAKKCKASPEIILSCVVPAYQKYCRFDDKAIKTQSCTELSNANSAILQWFYVKGYVEKSKNESMEGNESNTKIVDAWNTFFDEVRKKKATLRGKEQLNEEDVKNHMKEVKKEFAERFKGKDFKNDPRARENAKKLLLKEIADAEKQMEETKLKRAILEDEIKSFKQIKNEAEALKQKLEEKEALVKEQQVLVENLEKADELRLKLTKELESKLQRLKEIDGQDKKRPTDSLASINSASDNKKKRTSEFSDNNLMEIDQLP